MYIYIYIYIYIYKHVHVQSWPKISAPLLNMIKEGCENVSALLILFIFYLKYSQHSNLSLHNKNSKWGGGCHYEINVFLKYTLDTIIGTTRNSNEKNISEDYSHSYSTF